MSIETYFEKLAQGEINFFEPQGLDDNLPHVEEDEIQQMLEDMGY